MAQVTDSILKHHALPNSGQRPFVHNDQLLIELEWYLSKYFKNRKITTVETGCGEATLLFVNYSSSHTIYTIDDSKIASSHVKYVEATSRILKLKTKTNWIFTKAKWIFGSSLQTIVQKPLESDVDVVLINGLHFYPSPDFEYHALCKRLKKGGVLFIANTQIPTIANLCNFLKQESDFRFSGMKSGTAFFHRIMRNNEDDLVERWWNQKLNMREYDHSALEKINGGLALPIRYEFGRNITAMEPLQVRGAATQNGRWFTDGFDTSLKIRLAPNAPERISITLDIEPIAIAERLAANLTPDVRILANQHEVETYKFIDSNTRSISFDIERNGDDQLELEFWHGGTIAASGLNSFSRIVSFDTRMPNFYLNAIEIADQAKPSANVTTLRRTDGSIFSFTYQGKSISFLVNQINDSVQNFHANGRFYEIDELEIIRSFVKPKSSILEVGAHMGNHTVFFALFLHPVKIVVVEPNPRTQDILMINLALNGVRVVDQSRMNYALGADRVAGEFTAEKKYSSGSAFIKPTLEGGIRIIPGDELFASEKFDFIKIDVEGMELEVLAGLEKTIGKSKPTIFVEVADQNLKSFKRFLSKIGYEVKWQSKMYPEITNFIVQPLEI